MALQDVKDVLSVSIGRAQGVRIVGRHETNDTRASEGSSMVSTQSRAGSLGAELSSHGLAGDTSDRAAGRRTALGSPVSS